MLLNLNQKENQSKEIDRVIKYNKKKSDFKGKIRF